MLYKKYTNIWYKKYANIVYKHEEVLETRFDIIKETLWFKVLILDGNSKHIAHAWPNTGLFEVKKILFVTAPERIKCLEQIK